MLEWPLTQWMLTPWMVRERVRALRTARAFSDDPFQDLLGPLVPVPVYNPPPHCNLHRQLLSLSLDLASAHGRTRCVLLFVHLVPLVLTIGFVRSVRQDPKIEKSLAYHSKRPAHWVVSSGRGFNQVKWEGVLYGNVDWVCKCGCGSKRVALIRVKWQRGLG